MKNTGIKIVGNAVSHEHERGVAIIVVGVSRGGTSAIAASLNALGVSMGAKFQTPIYEDLDLAQALRSKNWHKLRSIIEDYESSNKIFGWKLPDSNEYLDRIYKYCSNPYFIFVYKDLLTISLRRNMVHNRDVFLNMGSAMKEYHKIHKFIQKKNPNSLHVSYEKMVSGKDEYARALAAFCGVEMNDKVLNDVVKSIGFDRSSYEIWADTTRQRELLKASGYDGCIDNITKKNISGWFVNLDSNEPVTLELLINDEMVTQIHCTEFREDLINASLSSTGRAGFNMNISNYSLRIEDVVAIRVKGTQYFLSKVYRG